MPVHITCPDQDARLSTALHARVSIPLHHPLKRVIQPERVYFTEQFRQVFYEIST